MGRTATVRDKSPSPDTAFARTGQPRRPYFTVYTSGKERILWPRREQLRRFQTRQPFPTLHHHAGIRRTFTVRHPELASCSTNGREMIVHDDDGMHFLEMLMVEIIEDARDPTRPEPPRGESNGG